ncbi:MAG: N4-gp56 family major capsid protein [Candidatus Moranbacteria bacterium RIFOXYD1_FULL_44_12]|nr:MAG: N4-gp56 family major capsid protein [Candidatus Moranbacteria bacterium RIFOXYD1_FULL_44_12]OGK67156.1 MAG: N4-gp56 family major capsid protein [Candidatus Roizmanbacteria bacterium RIFOXYB1_FULL_41_27]
MASTTTALSQLMQKYYDKLFIETAKHWLIHEEGAQKRPLPQGSGKIAYFQRYTPLAIITAALTEASNPTCVNLSATNVSVTVSEFGSYSKVSKLLSLTAVDRKMKGAVEVHAQNAGESRDQMVREKALVGATAQLAASSAALTDVGTTDTLSAAEVRKAVRTLKANKAMRYSDGYFLGKTSPYASYDLMGDSVWVNAHTYKDGDNLYKGELGRLHGVRFLETTNWKETANGGTSSADIIHSFIHGKNALGVTDLDGDEKKIYVKTPNDGDTSNPLNRYHTVGWAMTFAPVKLVSTWIIEIKSGATDQS